MNRNDYKNSEVRSIDVTEYDVGTSEYMQAYSFILSWGWTRVLDHTDQDNQKHFKWVDKSNEYKCDSVYQAQAIQRLRILTGGTDEASST